MADNTLLETCPSAVDPSLTEKNQSSALAAGGAASGLISIMRTMSAPFVGSFAAIKTTIKNRSMLTFAVLLLSISLLDSSIIGLSNRPNLAAQTKADEPTIDELASKLPPIPSSTPDASRQQVELAGDFALQLVASEPLIRDPVAVDFDESGRMYVVELPEYNGYAVEGFSAKGSIRLLTDTDRDGQYDQAVMFAENLDYPTAVACWNGGVFVGAAPDLLFLKDTDGDGKADHCEVVFTGFGKDKAGEAHLNSFRWGFDNRFHISTNLSGGDIRTPAQQNGISSRGRGIIFDPRDRTNFELTSGGGQHGLSMDDWGRKFVCSNSVPAQTLMYDDRYLARNPFVKAAAAAADIAPDGKHTRLFRISPEEPWRALRTKLRSTGKFRGSDEGGTPFGFFTGATGITIYRGNAWPPEYRGNLLVGDVANNLVYRAKLTEKGVGLIAHRADDEQEFLASKDIWFRPVQLANAPDGTLFVLDIYRGLIEGAAFLPPEFVKYIDPVGGNDLGRIYRIAPKGFASAKVAIDLSRLTNLELVQLLAHENGWHRDTASRLLYERQDRSVLPQMIQLAATSPLPVGRMTALYSIDGLQGLQVEHIQRALADSNPDVVIHALRLAEEFPSSPLLLADMESLTTNANERIRYQLTFTLGAMSLRARLGLLADVAKQDSVDASFRMALQSSLESGAHTVFASLLGDAEYRKTPHGQTFLLALADQIGAAGRDDELTVIIHALQTLQDSESGFATKVVESVVAHLKGKARQRILAAADGRAGELLTEMIATARIVAADSSRETPKRVEAIQSLQTADFGDVSELLTSLLDISQPAAVQSAVLKTVGQYDDDEIAKMVLRDWRGFSPAVRAEAAETLLSRPNWVIEFLNAVEKKTVRPSEISAGRIALLQRNPDRKIAARVEELFASSRLGTRQEVVDQYREALTLEGKREQGKLVFKKTCSACHRLENEGTQVGEDLSAIRNRGMAAVLLNILDPNREVKPQFHTYVANTSDGRVITGMIQTETANNLIIRRVDGTTVELRRGDIDELQSTGLSFMPEGLEKQVTLQQMADLLAYLESIR
jgi:putative membrane-bound dehydrogenase-like protein